MRKSVLSVLADICLWPVRVARARAALATLAALDDRGLADIGLGRHDLRDMTACALGEDPTARLAARARERAEAAKAKLSPTSPAPPPGTRARLSSRGDLAA